MSAIFKDALVIGNAGPSFKVSLVIIECPRCGARVKLEDGKVAPHDKGTCTGSKMVWESCTGSGATLLKENKDG